MDVMNVRVLECQWSTISGTGVPASHNRWHSNKTSMPTWNTWHKSNQNQLPTSLSPSTRPPQHPLHSTPKDVFSTPASTNEPNFHWPLLQTSLSNWLGQFYVSFLGECVHRRHGCIFCTLWKCFFFFFWWSSTHQSGGPSRGRVIAGLIPLWGSRLSAVGWLVGFLTLLSLRLLWTPELCRKQIETVHSQWDLQFLNWRASWYPVYRF